MELSVMLGCTYLLTTSGLVAGVIALTEGKPFLDVWRMSYLWAFPYYLLGAATAGLFEIAQKHLGWQTSMLVVRAANRNGRAGDIKKYLHQPKLAWLNRDIRLQARTALFRVYTAQDVIKLIFHGLSRTRTEAALKWDKTGTEAGHMRDKAGTANARSGLPEPKPQGLGWCLSLSKKSETNCQARSFFEQRLDKQTTPRRGGKTLRPNHLGNHGSDGTGSESSAYFACGEFT